MISGREKFSSTLISIDDDAANSDTERYKAACKSLIEIFKTTIRIVVLMKKKTLEKKAKTIKNERKRVVKTFKETCRKIGLEDSNEEEYKKKKI